MASMARRPDEIRATDEDWQLLQSSVVALAGAELGPRAAGLRGHSAAMDLLTEGLIRCGEGSKAHEGGGQGRGNQKEVVSWS